MTTADRRFGSASGCHTAIEEVWNKYLSERDLGLRDWLVRYYLPLVEDAARRLHRRLPKSVVLDDLVSTGAEGLLSAIEAFDPGRKTRFETFARTVIWGRMMDGLRTMDHQSRSLRGQAERLRKADERLRQALGRPPTPEEVCQELGLTADAFGELLRRVRAGRLVSATGGERGGVGQGGGSGGLDATRAFAGKSEAARPDEVAVRRDLKAHILKDLEREQRLVLVLYYAEGMTQKEIGQVMDVSESRVCQMLGEVRARLAAKVEDLRRGEVQG